MRKTDEKIVKKNFYRKYYSLKLTVEKKKIKNSFRAIREVNPHGLGDLL